MKNNYNIICCVILYYIMYFAELLKDKNINPDEYLKIANIKAKQHGYTNKIMFSDDTKHKLMTFDNTGLKIKFGNSKYNDYILYGILEHNDLIDVGTADKRRKLYLSRATKIKGDWKDNKYSKNNLAINILW